MYCRLHLAEGLGRGLREQAAPCVAMACPALSAGQQHQEWNAGLQRMVPGTRCLQAQQRGKRMRAPTPTHTHTKLLSC